MTLRLRLDTHAVHLQDTFTVNRLTLNLGVRWDRQSNEALGSTVPAHPFAPQWLPSVTFNGADSGVIWNDWSPRLGMTYDFMGTARRSPRRRTRIYYGQRSPNQLVNALNPVTAAEIRFPWTDTNLDKIVQAGELNYGTILNFGGNYNPDNPSALMTTGSVDPNIKNDRTREFIVGVDHELIRNLAVGASYIWRKYDQFAWRYRGNRDRLNFSSADYVARTFTPTCTVSGARCETVTYLRAHEGDSGARTSLTNIPDRWRDYQGMEFVLTKRYANRWMGSFSYAFNDAVDRWGFGKRV